MRVVQATIAGSRNFLADNQDLDALKEEIERACAAGGAFVDVRLSGDRVISVLISASTSRARSRARHASRNVIATASSTSESVGTRRALCRQMRSRWRSKMRPKASPSPSRARDQSSASRCSGCSVSGSVILRSVRHVPISSRSDALEARLGERGSAQSYSTQ